jgi:hypothetical protein
MNTAPQDDFSADLSRNLGGWSDDALMKELSRRTTMTTDGEHELISTGAGVLLQHRRDYWPEPIITYDADAEQWTVDAQQFGIMATDPTEAQGSIYTEEGAGKDSCVQYANYKFDKQSGTFRVDFVIPKLDGLAATRPLYSRLIYWTSSEDDSDICSDAGTLLGLSPHGHKCGLNRTLWDVSFYADGTWSSSFPKVPLQFAQQKHGRPSTLLSYHPPIAPSTSGAVSITGLFFGGEEYTYLAFAVPVNSDDNIVLARHTDAGLLKFGLEADLYDTWEDDLIGKQLVVGKIVTDSTGKCTEWKDYTGCQQQLPGGIGATVTIDGTTLSFSDGLLVGVTT